MSSAWRHDLIPILSLAGVILDALGGLYLAYDLLGGKRGPLRTVTKSISYGVLFGTAYALPLGVWFGLVGLLVSGPALSIEIRRRDLLEVHPFFEALAFGLLRAVSFGAAGWLSKDSWFGTNFGILSALGFVASYVIVGPPAVTSPGHPCIDKAVLMRALFRGDIDRAGCGIKRARFTRKVTRYPMAWKWAWLLESRVQFWLLLRLP